MLMFSEYHLVKYVNVKVTITCFSCQLYKEDLCKSLFKKKLRQMKSTAL